MRMLSILLLIILLSACATTKTNYVKYKRKDVQQKKELYFDINSTEQVSFHGQIEDANLNSSPNGMMYPGYNAGGFLTSIIAHAVIADSMKDSRLTELQTTADEDISEISGAYEEITYHTLLQLNPQTFEKFRFKESEMDKVNENTEWLVKVSPVFYVRSDLSIITLKNVIRVFDVNTDKPIYENLVEVISYTGNNSKDINIEFWMSDDGIHLKQSAANLFAESMELFKGDFYKEYPSEKKQQTFKLLSGDYIHIERGNLIRESCDQTVFRGLRGWLKSVPTKLRANTRLECLAQK